LLSLAVAPRSARIPQTPAIRTHAPRNQGSPGNRASIAAVAIVAEASRRAAMRDGRSVTHRTGADFTHRLGALARDASIV
jgi:hypothetical protein